MPCQMTRGQVKGTIIISFSENAGKKQEEEEDTPINHTGHNCNMTKMELFISKIESTTMMKHKCAKKEKSYCIFHLAPCHLTRHLDL